MTSKEEPFNLLFLANHLDKAANAKHKMPRSREARTNLLKSYLAEESEKARILAQICRYLNLLDIHVRTLQIKTLQIKDILKTV